MALGNRIAITGVTGFVGRGLPRMFSEAGLSVTGISRAGGGVAGVDRWRKPDELDFSGHLGVVHLAGEPVAQRWTKEAKRRFRESRVDFTERIVHGLARIPGEHRPKVLVNASAVGFYGDRGDMVLDESAGPGDGYLAELCRDWEAAAVRAEDLGVRVVRLRIGMVLGRGGGAFGRLRGVFRWGLGGRLGNGRQWMPWIHEHDLRRAILHALLSSSLEGAVNGSAPQPERNADFTRKLAGTMNRPAIFPVPAAMLKLGLGEFSEALLSSQRVVPGKLLSDGFRFRFPDLESALENLLEERDASSHE